MTVWPGVHVETVSVTTSVVYVVVSAGWAGFAGGVLTAAGGVMGISLGQFVIKPGFCGIKAAQIPCR